MAFVWSPFTALIYKPCPKLPHGCMLMLSGAINHKHDFATLSHLTRYISATLLIAIHQAVSTLVCNHSLNQHQLQLQRKAASAATASQNPSCGLYACAQAHLRPTPRKTTSTIIIVAYGAVERLLGPYRLQNVETQLSMGERERPIADDAEILMQKCDSEIEEIEPVAWSLQLMGMSARSSQAED